MRERLEASAENTQSTQRDNPNLDFLRAMAVTMVVVFHLLLFFGVWRQYGKNLSRFGYAGVFFFFVHTSLVLMFSLERLTRKYSGADLYLAFMIRRCFRIYPLGVLAVIIIVLFQLPMGHVGPLGFQSVHVSMPGLISNLLLTQNLTNTESILGPLWSLPLELQMYVFLPLLFFMAVRIRTVRPLILLWVMAVALGLVQIRFGHLPDLVRYIPCFLPGIIAFKSGEKSVRRVPFILWPVFIF